MHVFHGGANRSGAVGEDVDFDRRRKCGLKLREKLLHAVDDGDDVGARLALNVENDRRILIGPGGLFAVFHTVDDVGNIADTNRSAVAISNDQRLVAVAREQLVVRADGVGLMQAVESTLGHVHIGLA